MFVDDGLDTRLVRGHASRVTSLWISAWQARMYPPALSSLVSASCTAIVTRPDTSLTRHAPHVPDRQALSMKTPASSATSRIVAPTGTSAAESDVRKTTLPATSAEVARFAVGSRFTVPNASVR